MSMKQLPSVPFSNPTYADLYAKLQERIVRESTFKVRMLDDSFKQMSLPDAARVLSERWNPVMGDASVAELFDFFAHVLAYSNSNTEAVEVIALENHFVLETGFKAIHGDLADIKEAIFVLKKPVPAVAAPVPVVQQVQSSEKPVKAATFPCQLCGDAVDLRGAPGHFQFKHGMGGKAKSVGGKKRAAAVAAWKKAREKNG